MSIDNQEQDSIDSVTNNHASVDKSKRKFSKAGMAAPVMLGLASRPSWVMAVDENCSFKAAVSGNISADPNTQCTDGRLSTRSPGVFKGVAGETKWTEYGVDGLRSVIFGDVFTNLPGVKFKDGSATTLEAVIRASRKEFVNEPDNKFSDETTYTNSTNRIFHYVGAYLMAMSTTAPDTGSGEGIIHPYSALQIVNDWGVWGLYNILQDLQDDDMTVAQVNDYFNP